MSSSRPSTFVDRALLPVYAHKELKSVRRIQKWELAQYAPVNNAEWLQALQSNSNSWDQDAKDTKFWVMSPSRWRFLPKLDYQQVAPTDDRFPVPVYGGHIPFRALKRDLVVKGLLEEAASVRRLTLGENKQLVRLYYQLVPDPKCVRKMAHYLYASNAALLHLLSAHSTRTLFSDGFAKKTIPPGSRALWANTYSPDYRLDLRITPSDLVRYLALDNRTRYNNLNKVLLGSPGCSSPVILVSGQYSSLGWRKATLGTFKVWRRMFAAATYVHFEQAEKLKVPYLFVFHLRQGTPWLLLQPASGLSLMPAGLKYQLMLRTRVYNKWVYHFMVSART